MTFFFKKKKKLLSFAADLMCPVRLVCLQNAVSEQCWALSSVFIKLLYVWFQGCTPLHIAAQHGHEEVHELLAKTYGNYSTQ